MQPLTSRMNRTFIAFVLAIFAIATVNATAPFDAQESFPTTSRKGDWAPLLEQFGRHKFHKLVHKAFHIRIKHIHLEKVIATLYAHRLLGNSVGAIHILKVIRHLYKHQKTRIKAFEYAFGIPISSVPYFGALSPIPLDQLSVGVPYPNFGLSLHEYKKLVHKAKHNYLHELHIDTIRTIMFKFRMLGLSHAAFAYAKTLIHLEKHQATRISSFRTAFGVDYYSVPLFGSYTTTIEYYEQ